MRVIEAVDIIAVLLLALHYGVPAVYYYIVTKSWAKQSWALNLSYSYQPKISIIIPTYNEARNVAKKLDNIASQDYPVDKMEIIVVDSASTDTTVEEVLSWGEKHPKYNLNIIKENIRRGKAHALNHALTKASGDIIVITDADAYWAGEATLHEVVRWLSDPIVGAVSCLKKPASRGPGGIEENYRLRYNQLRLGESKKYSTPIFHGELAAFRRECLERVGGFPTDIGADDSHTATLIALRGKRAITPETVYCLEKLPKGMGEYNKWRIRRAQHLVQHFSRIVRMLRKAPKGFRSILLFEAYIHLINPWILWTALALLAFDSIRSTSSLVLLTAMLLVSLLPSNMRTWIASQAFLSIGAIKNLYSRELVWSKQEK